MPFRRGHLFSVTAKRLPKLLHQLEPFGNRHSLDLGSLKHVGNLTLHIGQSKRSRVRKSHLPKTFLKADSTDHRPSEPSTAASFNLGMQTTFRFAPGYLHSFFC